MGFTLIEDTALGSGKRWVVAAPAHANGARLLLARVAPATSRSGGINAAT